jgi:hypothetical protein
MSGFKSSDPVDMGEEGSISEELRFISCWLILSSARLTSLRRRVYSLYYRCQRIALDKWWKRQKVDKKGKETGEKTGKQESGGLMSALKQEEEYGYDIPMKRSELHYLSTEIALTTRSINQR